MFETEYFKSIGLVEGRPRLPAFGSPVQESCPVKLPYPGRRVRKAKRAFTVLALVVLTLLSGFSSLLPNLLEADNPPGLDYFGSMLGTTVEPPKVSLPPGTIQYGSRAPPFLGQVVDSSFAPILVSTKDAYVYETSFGQYSFNKTMPFMFSLHSRSSTPLTEKSFFFITTLASLTAGSANVTVATTDRFEVSYEVLSQNSVVGQLVLRADFHSNSRPKFTISFTKTDKWTFGGFNIVWPTLTPLRWTRVLNSSVTADLRMPIPTVLAATSKLELGSSKDPSIWTEWLTTDWKDAPGSVLVAGDVSVAGSSGKGFMVVFPTDEAFIDPTQVGTSTVDFATAYSTQRKTFYYGGYYFLFWYDGNSILYSTSPNGQVWSPVISTGSGRLNYGFDLFTTGPMVALAWLNYSSSIGGDGVSSLLFRNGTIVGNSIYWDSTVTVASISQPYSWPPSVGIGLDGAFWTGGIWQDLSGAYKIWIYQSDDGISFTLSNSYPTSDSGVTRFEALQLIPLKAGRLMALTSHQSDTTIRWTVWDPLKSSWSSIASNNLSLQANSPKWNTMSAVRTPDGHVDLLFYRRVNPYPGTFVNEMASAEYNATNGQWTVGQAIYSGEARWPSISADELGNLYGFWVCCTGSGPTNVMYSVKPKEREWSAPTTPFGPNDAAFNIHYWVSATRAASRTVFLAWTLINGVTGEKTILYGSIPLPSGVASAPPSEPWNRLGLSATAPAGEYVSPGNGLLTISQVDISVPGRGGLGLSISRIYSQPFTFLQDIPHNYETSPYASLGNGWQLELPWVGTRYLHFLGGQTYPIIWTKYTVSTNGSHEILTWSFENHEREDFLFSRTRDYDTITGTTNESYKLTTEDGTVYNFDVNGVVTSIADRTGQNQIRFNYSGLTSLTKIIDTIDREVIFQYNGGRLANVTYGGQTVTYGYSGNSLVSVSDSIGRTLTFQYSGPGNWLISQVTYPTGGRTTYEYGAVTIGTDALNYLVTLQNVYAGSLTRSTSFSYEITDGSVTFANITESDGTTVQGFTTYEFNLRSRSITQTLLGADKAQIKKVKTWYDDKGRPVHEDVYNSNSTDRSFYLSRFYDNWGNVIYNRDAIGHETYSSYANTDTQYMFYGPGKLAPSVDGRIFYDDFNNPGPDAAIWVQGGSAASRTTTTRFSLLTLQGASSLQGAGQSSWVRTSGTFGYPFYAEVQMSLDANPGLATLDAEFILSPQATPSNGDPYVNRDALRLILNDGPFYRVHKNVGGSLNIPVYDEGPVQGGSLSVSWKIVLSDQNTLTVFLNTGSGYRRVVQATSLGLSSSFTPAYVYLALRNQNTIPYVASFDYVGLIRSNTITIMGLQSGQRFEVYDSNDVLHGVQNGATVDVTTMVFPYGYVKIYELDGRTAEYVSPTREFWGGSTYSYFGPFRSGGFSRTTTGFVRSSGCCYTYVEDNVPFGATSGGEGDSWVWLSRAYGPVASGSFSHVSLTSLGSHQHYFYGSLDTPPMGPDAFHIQYIYIPSNSVPSEVMLQFRDTSGSWDHRAYWGSNSINLGVDGASSRRPMGPLPGLRDTWLMLIVKAADVGTGQLTIDGLAYMLYSGGAYWDHSAIGYEVGGIRINNLQQGQKAEFYDSNGILKSSSNVPSGFSYTALDLYSAGINVFPASGFLKIYSASGSLQYSSALMTDIWGGDSYEYHQPIFFNSFNPSPPAGSIHNALVGQAEYQKAGSTSLELGTVPQEAYFEYDAVGNLAKERTVHDGSPIISTHTYDMYGNVKTTVVAEGQENRKIFYEYSTAYGQAYLTEFKRALTPTVNVTTTYTYNPASGNMVSVMDPMGKTTDYEFDSIGRIRIVKHPPVNGLRSQIEVFYYDSQNAIAIRNEKGNYTRILYDGLGREIRVERYSGDLSSALLSSESYAYNWQGLVKTYTAPDGNVTSYEYDFPGRLLKVTNPDGSYRITTYDDANLTSSSIDESQHRTDYLYDHLGRVKEVREYYSAYGYYSTQYFYDAVGNVVMTVNAKGQLTSHFYDDLDRRVLTKYPDGFLEESYAYDNLGNLVSRRDPNGNTITYTLDALDRLVQTNYPNATVATFNYDKNSNLVSASNPESSVAFSYDPRDRLTGETWTIGGGSYTLSYRYDAVGNLVGITYPDLTSVSYEIDALDRVTTAKSGSTTLATFTYAANQRVQGVTYGNGINTSYTHDKMGQPTRIKVADGAKIPLDLNYAYDGSGNIQSITGTSTESYSYDFLDRLTYSSGPWGELWYGYDAIGNRQWIKQGTTNTTYTYGPYDNRLTAVGSTSYGYDNNGNLKTKTSGSSTTYEYDFENRLTKVTRDSSILGTYSYTPFGQRIRSVEAGTTTIHLSVGFNVLYERKTTPTGTTTIDKFVYVGDFLVARLSGSDVFYYHQDHLGSTRLVTKGNKTQFSSNYQPFGPQHGATGTDPVYKYTGKPASATTGLYYYGARWYDPETGRFTTPDPVRGILTGPGSVNEYAYVQNNPTRYVDPTGLFVVDPFGPCIDSCVWGPAGPPDTRAAAAAFINGVDVSHEWGLSLGVLLTWRLSMLQSYRCRHCFIDSPDGTPTPRSSNKPSTRNTAAKTTGTQPRLGTGESFNDVVEATACSVCWKGYQYGSYPGYRTRWATPTRYQTSNKAHQELSLPDHNTAAFVRSVYVPRGETIWISKVPALPGRPGTGGGIQIRVSSPDVFIGGPWVRIGLQWVIRSLFT